MNEAIRIELSADGAPVALDGLSSEGLTINQEPGAPARGLTVSCQPDDPVTEFRLGRVRQIQDWHSDEFRVKLSVDANALEIRGIDGQSLPFGRYRLRVAISELEAVDQPIDVVLPEGASAPVKAAFRADPRRFRFTTPVSDFDPGIHRVVTDLESSLDGEPVPVWLGDPAPRARRKACLLNIMAKLRAARGPASGSHLIDDVSSVFFADVDRVYLKTGSTLAAQLHTLAGDPAKPFYEEGSPKAEVHKQLLDRVRSTGDGRTFSLLSYRQEGEPSMQLVLAVPSDEAAPYYVDDDIDLGNPLQDLRGAVIHAGELLAPGKTDHLKLAGELAHGPTGDFLYYRVERAAIG